MFIGNTHYIIGKILSSVINVCTNMLPHIRDKSYHEVKLRSVNSLPTYKLIDIYLTMVIFDTYYVVSMNI